MRQLRHAVALLREAEAATPWSAVKRTWTTKQAPFVDALRLVDAGAYKTIARRAPQRGKTLDLCLAAELHRFAAVLHHERARPAVRALVFGSDGEPSAWMEELRALLPSAEDDTVAGLASPSTRADRSSPRTQTGPSKLPASAVVGRLHVLIVALHTAVHGEIDGPRSPTQRREAHPRPAAGGGSFPPAGATSPSPLDPCVDQTGAHSITCCGRNGCVLEAGHECECVWDEDELQYLHTRLEAFAVRRPLHPSPLAHMLCTRGPGRLRVHTL
jgi:hypothetical protein